MVVLLLMCCGEWWLLLLQTTARQHSSCWQDSIFTSVLWALDSALSSKAHSKVTSPVTLKAYFKSFCSAAARCTSPFWILHSMVTCYFVSLSLSCLWVTATISTLGEGEKSVTTSWQRRHEANSPAATQITASVKCLQQLNPTQLPLSYIPMKP